MDIKITFDTLSDDLIKKIKQYPSVADTLKTNLTDWDPKLVGTSGTIFLYYLKDELLESVKAEIITKFPKPPSLNFAYLIFPDQAALTVSPTFKAISIPL